MLRLQIPREDKAGKRQRHWRMKRASACSEIHVRGRRTDLHRAGAGCGETSNLSKMAQRGGNEDVGAQWK